MRLSIQYKDKTIKAKNFGWLAMVEVINGFIKAYHSHNMPPKVIDLKDVESFKTSDG